MKVVMMGIVVMRVVVVVMYVGHYHYQCNH